MRPSFGWTPCCCPATLSIISKAFLALARNSGEKTICKSRDMYKQIIIRVRQNSRVQLPPPHHHRRKMERIAQISSLTPSPHLRLHTDLPGPTLSENSLAYHPLPCVLQPSWIQLRRVLHLLKLSKSPLSFPFGPFSCFSYFCRAFGIDDIFSKKSSLLSGEMCLLCWYTNSVSIFGCFLDLILSNNREKINL